MRQSFRTILLALLPLLVVAAACDRPRPTAATGGIVSLTPAGTDLLVAMGLTDRIVGVSPFEANDDLRRRLPKVGDYFRIDWEKLTELKPAYLVVQGKKDRLPSGTREHCQELGIRPIVLQIDRLDDINAAVRQLGRDLGDTSAAARAVAEMERRTDALRQTPIMPVPTLIVFGDTGKDVVGRKTFLDDVLTLAGGANVIEADLYVTIDREKLASLKPAVVFLILPDADANLIERTKQPLLDDLPTGTAIHVITTRDALVPGTSALKLAEMMAADLRTPP